MFRAFLRGVIASLLLAALPGGALAQVSDRVHFRVGPQLVAWVDGAAPVHGAAIDLSAGEARLASWPGTMPGLLVPVGFDDDAGMAPQVRHLAVASNTAFTLRADLPAGAAGAWRLETRLVGQGTGAQAGRLILSDVSQLASGETSQLAYSPEKTARLPGNAQSQALLLEITLTPQSAEAARTPPRLMLLAAD